MKIINNQFNQSSKSITNKSTLYFFFFSLLFLFNCPLPVDFKTTITGDDFTITDPEVERKQGYVNTEYGQIILNPGIDATFSIVSGKTPNAKTPNAEIAVDESGNITIPTGLEVGEYPFQVAVNGSYDYEGSVEVDFKFVVKPHTGSIAKITDIKNLALTTSSNPPTIEFATAEARGEPYLFISSRNDDKLYMFKVESDGGLTKVTEVANSDSSDYRFNDPEGIVATIVGGKTYVIVAGTAKVGNAKAGNQGLSMFEVDASGGQLINVTNISNSRASKISIIQNDGKTYVFTGFKDADFINNNQTKLEYTFLSLYEISSAGKLIFLDDVEEEITKNNKSLTLSDLVPLEINNEIFLFVSHSQEKDVLNAYRIVNNKLSSFKTLSASSLSDNDSNSTHGFLNFNVTKIKDNINFILLNSTNNVADKVTTFDIELLEVGAVLDIKFNKLTEIPPNPSWLGSSTQFVTTEIDDGNYIFFFSFNRDEVGLFSFTDDGGVFEIKSSVVFPKKISAAITIKVDEKTYLFTNGREDVNTINVFEIKNN